nr:cellulose biosynthesis cyclic di-GMP-binding regulatory protein BcsB [Ardenticatenales bacterium]
AANLWVTIDSESSLHLPLAKPQGTPVRTLDLARYSNPRTLGLSLDRLAFVLPPQEPTAWAVAAQVAFDLGNRAEGSAAEILALYGRDLPATVQQRDLIIVGRPSTLPLVAELGTVLPAPFEAGSDLASESKMRVVYRLPERSSIGYLELARAPWSSARVILTVLGSTDEGIQWAGNALTTPSLRGRLTGDLALVGGEQISSVDTQRDARNQGAPDAFLSLEQLGFNDRILRGPFDSVQILFNLPAEWELTEGAEMQLDLDTTFGGSVILPEIAEGTAISPTSAGTLEISFNGAVIDSVSLDRPGLRTLTLSIPPEVLVSTRRDRQHQLRVALDSSLQCNVQPQGTVLLQARSRLSLPHRIVSPSTALQFLPRPIYQGSFMTDTATLVVPDEPTAGELQAALSVAAGFGRLTSGKLQLTLHSISELPNEVRENTHLIFVGRGAALPLLSEIKLPAPLTGEGFEGAGAAEDGVVQMALSPWNPLKVVLVVSGASEEAVLKAGGAVSTGVVRAGPSPSLAVITEVRQLSEDASRLVLTDRTLGDMGYVAETVQSVGLNWNEYNFYMPPGMKVDGEGYFELRFSHTAKLDYARSEIIVRLNDEPIGSVRLNDDTAQQGIMRFYVPPSVLRAGNNRLSVQSTLMPSEPCVDPRLATIWLTVRPESLLHIPLIAEGDPRAQILDMSRYGNVARLGLSFNQIAFVLPTQAPLAWQVAASVAFDLGHRGDGTPSDLLATYSDALSPELRLERSLIVVGQPSTLPLITELSEELPAAFEPGSDLAIERNMRVIYEVPDGTSLGYLQLLASPWNRQRAILAILGSTPEGVQWAGRALTDATLRGRLSGNYAVINGEQIVVGDTRLGGGAISLAATVVPGGESKGIPAAPPPASERLWWVPPVIGVAILTMIAIIALVGFSWWRRRRAPTI